MPSLAKTHQSRESAVSLEIGPKNRFPAAGSVLHCERTNKRVAEAPSHALRTMRANEQSPDADDCSGKGDIGKGDIANSPGKGDIANSPGGLEKGTEKGTLLIHRVVWIIWRTDCLSSVVDEYHAAKRSLMLRRLHLPRP
jgi:hypothetical protein